MPYAPESRNYFASEFGSEEGGLNRSEKWAPAAFEPYVRKTICNAQGDFTFDNLPDGKYYAVAVITWEAPSGGAYSYMQQQGGAVATLVEVSGGEAKSIVVTQ